jgi:hypothetical protein
MKKLFLLAASSLLLVMASCNKLDPSVDPNDLIPSIGGFDYAGASLSQFSVSDSHAVRFSRGNLQYNDSLQSWVFAEHQYDYIGLDDTNIAPGYRGWIDLFGFGTSGWNSGAIAYQPYSTSTTGVHYWPGGSAGNTLTGTYKNADWGVFNAISNGGNAPNMWRVMTRSEQEYLYFARSASTVNGVENARFVKANVNGVNGLIIFPDVYDHPDAVTLPTGINATSTTYATNTYNSTQWTLLEANGCIFLPAAGYRTDTDYYHSAGLIGRYYTSTVSLVEEGTGYLPRVLNFEDGQFSIDWNHSYYNANSVRLVRDAQ